MQKQMVYAVSPSLHINDPDFEHRRHSELHEVLKVKGNFMDVIIGMPVFDQSERKVLFKWDHNLGEWKKTN